MILDSTASLQVIATSSESVYRNDPADGGDEDQDDDELENTHFGNPLGDPWLLHRCDTPDFPARAIGETPVT